MLFKWKTILLEDIKKMSHKSIESSAEIFTKRVLDYYESLNLFSDGIFFNFSEKICNK